MNATLTDAQVREQLIKLATDLREKESAAAEATAASNRAYVNSQDWAEARQRGDENTPENQAFEAAQLELERADRALRDFAFSVAGHEHHATYPATAAQPDLVPPPRVAVITFEKPKRSP